MADKNKFLDITGLQILCNKLLALITGKANADLSNVDRNALKDVLQGALSAASIYEAIIGTDWTENSDTGVKTQFVEITGITAEHTAKVDHSNASVDGTSDGYATFVEEENQYLTHITNGFAETVEGGIEFTIFGDAPTVPIPIIVEVV